MSKEITDEHIRKLVSHTEVSGCNRNIDFARMLERELDAANKRIAELETQIEELVSVVESARNYPLSFGLSDRAERAIAHAKETKQ